MSSAHLQSFDDVRPAQIEWRNGLPFSLEFNDIYYSQVDGLAESEYVFIEGCELLSDWKVQCSNHEQKLNKSHFQQFKIAELGFGSGLNFFITANHWINHTKKTSKNTPQSLHYISIEKRPFAIEDFIRSCQLWPQFESIQKQLIENYPSLTYGRHQFQWPEYHLSLTLFYMPAKTALNDLIKESNYRGDTLKIDHWFLDGFAPALNESMWGNKIADQIAALSHSGSKLATFSVAAAVKKPLSSVGFTLDKRKGFGKKREMLTGIFQPQMMNSVDNKSTEQAKNKPKFVNLKFEKPWLNYKPQENSSYNIAIIGAGIAGCSLANRLSQYPVKIDVFERNSKIASEASGAAAGIFHPQLTADMNLGSQLNWLAFLYLIRYLATLTKNELEKIVLSRGIKRFLASNKLQTQMLALTEQIRLQAWFQPDSQYKNNRAIDIKHAMAINMPAYCNLLIQNKSSAINIATETNIESLEKIKNYWRLTYYKNNQTQFSDYDHVIYCGGANSNLLDGLIKWEKNITRGQTCFFQSKKLKGKITQPLCEKTYLVPQNNDGEFQLGTTFENFIDDQLNQKSQNEMLANCNKLLLELNLPTLSDSECTAIPLNGTLGYRLHSSDRLPLIGPYPAIHQLENEFKGYGQKRIKRSELNTYNDCGLWLNCGYGSHGLLYSMICATHLVSMIMNDVSPIPSKIAEALHPSRMIIKNLKK